MSAQWKKFTGSEEQIREIRDAKKGWLARSPEGVECDTYLHGLSKNYVFCTGGYTSSVKEHLIGEYLICQPHPHADMIIEWARTGREVYVRGDIWDNGKWRWELCENPSWIPQVKYSFNPDGDEV